MRRRCSRPSKRPMRSTARLDVVVNNAGYGLLGSVEEATEAGDRASVRRELPWKPAVSFQAVLPHLRAQRSGHIVNITSIAGLAPGAGSGFYAAAKFAVEGMSQSLAQEIAPLGIKVTLVEPGRLPHGFPLRTLDPLQPCGDRGLYSDGGAPPMGPPRYHGPEKQIGRSGGARRRGDHRGRACRRRPPLHLVLGSDAF